MPGEFAIESLADLVQAGAHRSLEAFGVQGSLDAIEATRLLLSRFGSELQTSNATIGVLTGRVQDALRAAAITAQGQLPIAAEIPSLPGFPAGYSYTVIGYIVDPLRGGSDYRELSFPVKVTSNTLLSRPELQEQVDQLLSKIAQQGAPRFGAELASPEKYKVTAFDIVREPPDKGGLPDISVLSIYRGE